MGHHVRRSRRRPAAPARREREDLDPALSDAWQRAATRRRHLSRLSRSARRLQPGRLSTARALPHCGGGRRPHPAGRPSRSPGVDRVLRGRCRERAAESGVDRVRRGAGGRRSQLGRRPAWRRLCHDERRDRGVGVAGRQRVGGAAAERGHRGQRHRGVGGRAVRLHRRLGRGKADAPVAWSHAGTEGRHPARVQTRQPAHGARRLRHVRRRSHRQGRQLDHR